MTDAEKLELSRATVAEEIDLLLAWSRESITGGWSTHQTRPQLDRAEKLALVLHRIS